MKAAFTILLFYHAMQVASSAFDLYRTMDDARSAIMSFYDLTPVESETKPSTTLKPDPTTVKTRSSLGSAIRSKVKFDLLPLYVPERVESVKSVASIKSVKAVPKLSKKHRKLNKFSFVGLSSGGASIRSKKVFSPKLSIKHSKITPLYGRPGPVGSTKVFPKLSIRRPSFVKPFPFFKPSPLPKTTQIMKKSKPVASKRISLNKFAEAIEDIEKALADAQLVGRVKHNEQRLRKLRDLIKTAVQKRSYRFARKAIGEAMFTIKKINEQR